MANGSNVRWFQLPILIPPLSVLVLGSAGYGVVQAQVQDNKEEIRQQEEEDRQLRARVTGTEINQAVVKSNTEQIRMGLEDLDEDVTDLNRKLDVILRRLPPQ